MQSYSEQQIVQSSFVKTAIVLPEIDSTNAYAKRMILADSYELPAVVITKSQTAGRGRQGNSWWSGQGSMCFTLVLPTQTETCLASVATAIAVCQTVRKFCELLKPVIKWPNDVMLNGKKLCGILIEKIAIQKPVTLVGVGINTNCSLDDADPEIQQTATSLIDETGQPIDQQQFLIQLLEMLNSWIHDSPKKGIIDTFMSISQFKKGQPIRIETSRFGTVCGKFSGIGMNGALLLSVDGKRLEVESGTRVTMI